MKKQQCIHVFRYLHALCLTHSHDVQEFFLRYPNVWFFCILPVEFQCVKHWVIVNRSFLHMSEASANLHFKFQPYPKHIWLFGITRRDSFPCFKVIYFGQKLSRSSPSWVFLSFLVFLSFFFFLWLRTVWASAACCKRDMNRSTSSKQWFIISWGMIHTRGSHHIACFSF